MKENEKGTSLNDESNTQKQQFTVKCNSCGNVTHSDVRGESTQCTLCGGTTTTVGVSAHGVPAHIKEEEKGMKEKIDKLEKELSTLKEGNDKLKKELTEKSESLTKAITTVEELKKESDEAKGKIEEIEKATEKKIEEAKVDAIKVTERKSELGEEFSKDVDLLNDQAYELAKVRKQLAEKDTEIASLKEKSPIAKDLNKGSEDKDADDEIKTKHSKVHNMAYEERK